MKRTKVASVVHKSAVAGMWKDIGILGIRIFWKIILSQLLCTLMLIFEGDLECNLICSIKSCMIFAIMMHTLFKNEIVRMGKSTKLEALVRFCQAVETLYTRDYLRRPTPRDLQRLLQKAEA
ncbi:hypothetical protein L3X38_009743 [Prunus dulcis]|uniref:Uncharacterized protein n=1 Tax=Prunus dulcis TaxID=3755 RepID=A0AAD4WE97_PRUDU|nr:hypothetical protein L3X38_009743 [Prunus dulcis]